MRGSESVEGTAGPRSYKDLDVWRKAMDLSLAVYDSTRSFPREELYGLTNQLRRAAVSIVSNIAEGHGRGSVPQLIQFLSIARGSAFEIEAQLLLENRLCFGEPEALATCASLCDEVSRMLFASIRSLEAKTKK